MMRETLRFIFKHKLLILKTALPLSLILLLGYALLLVGYNLETAARGMENRFALEIFIKNDMPEKSVDSLEHYLKLQPACQRTEIISRQAALDRMTGILDEDPTGALGYNPLPMSIVFYPKDSYKNRTYLEILKDQMEKNRIVERAVFAGDWLLELENFNIFFVRITSIFLILVVLAYILLFHMALNHLWLKYRDTAGKLHLLGMSRLRLRLPALAWSLLTGLLTSVLGLILTGIASGLISSNLITLQFFQPRHVFAIIAVFTTISFLLAIFKRMKIPTYE
jgi:cell division protein FtsX